MWNDTYIILTLPFFRINTIKPTRQLIYKLQKGDERWHKYNSNDASKIGRELSDCIRGGCCVDAGAHMVVVHPNKVEIAPKKTRLSKLISTLFSHL